MLSFFFRETKEKCSNLFDKLGGANYPFGYRLLKILDKILDTIEGCFVSYGKQTINRIVRYVELKQTIDRILCLLFN